MNVAPIRRHAFGHAVLPATQYLTGRSFLRIQRELEINREWEA